MQILGEINVLGSTKAVTRKIPYKITYKRGNQRELAIECNALKVKGYEDAMMTVRFDSSGLKLAFGTRAPGEKEPQYEIHVSGQTETHGKCFHAQAQWKKVKLLTAFNDQKNPISTRDYLLVVITQHCGWRRRG